MKLFSNVPLILFLSSEIFQICCVSAGEVIANNLRGRRAEGHAAHHHVIKNDDMCLSLDGRNVIIKDCDGDKKQVWDVDNEENEITNEDNDECLDLNVSNNNIGTWKCRGTPNQKFKWDEVKNEIKVLFFDKSDWCLTRDSNDNIFARPCNDGSNQKFFKGDKPLPTPIPPVVVTIKNENECLSLDVENVVMENCNGDKKQNWLVEDEENKITNEANDKCMDLNTKENNNIGTWKCNGNNNQKFKWDPDEKVIRVLNFTNKDWCLTRGTDDNVFALPCNGKSNQKFVFSTVNPTPPTPTPPAPTPPTPVGQVTIKNENECLSLESLDVENVVMENCNGDKKQNWLVDDEENEITNEANDKCMDLNEDNNNIGTWKCNGNNNQKFKWDPDEKVIRVLNFANKDTNKDWCMTRDTEDNVFALPCNGKSNQKFEFSTTPGLGKKFVADFDQTDVKGYFKIKIQENGNARYNFEVNLNDFASHNDCDLREGLTYHIHSTWNEKFPYALGLDCGAENTGGHYDPFLACGPATSNTDECKALARTKDDNYKYKCKPKTHSKGEYQKCEVGDLSGKFGKVMPASPSNLIYNSELTDVFGPLEANFNVNEDDGITKSWASIVFHCAADGGSRQFCAEFKEQ